MSEPSRPLAVRAAILLAVGVAHLLLGAWVWEANGDPLPPAHELYLFAGVALVDALLLLALAFPWGRAWAAGGMAGLVGLGIGTVVGDINLARVGADCHAVHEARARVLAHESAERALPASLSQAGFVPRRGLRGPAMRYEVDGADFRIVCYDSLVRWEADRRAVHRGR